MALGVVVGKFRRVRDAALVSSGDLGVRIANVRDETLV